MTASYPMAKKEIFELTETQLARQLREFENEIARRTRAQRQNAPPDVAGIIRGNEYAKRAIKVAAVGGHSICFFGPPESGRGMLRALAYDLQVTKTFEAWPCECGGHGNPYRPCSCDVEGINAYRCEWPLADIYVEVTASHAGLLEQPLGEPFIDMMKLTTVSRGRVISDQLTTEARKLLKGASSDFGFTLADIEIIKRVAASCAKLGTGTIVGPEHVAEAVGYRRR